MQGLFSKGQTFIAGGELRIRVPDGWNFERTSHGNAVTESGLVRVMLERDSNGPVDWSIRFSRAK